MGRKVPVPKTQLKLTQRQADCLICAIQIEAMKLFSKSRNLALKDEAWADMNILYKLVKKLEGR